MQVSVWLTQYSVPPTMQYRKRVAWLGVILWISSMIYPATEILLHILIILSADCYFYQLHDNKGPGVCIVKYKYVTVCDEWVMCK